MTNNHLTYIGEFKKNSDSVGFIKDGQDETTDDIDFNRQVSISLEDPITIEVNGIPLGIKTFVVASINTLLEKNEGMLLNKPNTVVSVLNYFS